MKSYLSAALGLLLLVAPLWTLSGFATVPEHRTGTIADYQTALISGATLYGGVFIGVLISERFKLLRTVPAFRRIFLAGIAGAMGAITLALIASFLGELASTGRLMPPGQTPALLPVLYIVGGILSAFMAAGVGLIAYGLGRPTR
jgi:NhaP-type Na+/H+ or K+/H+ antiporter